MHSSSALAPPLASGRVLLGRYRILRQLARGGMGVVHLGRIEGAQGFAKPVVIKTILATGGESAQLFAREARIVSQLQHAGIDGYFTEVITSEKSNSMKPHPEIFEYAMKTTGAACPDCLMIGDALDIDVLGAMRVGMDCVYYNPKRVVHEVKPTYEVAHLEELMKIV